MNRVRLRSWMATKFSTSRARRRADASCRSISESEAACRPTVHRWAACCSRIYRTTTSQATCVASSWCRIRIARSCRRSSWLGPSRPYATQGLRSSIRSWRLVSVRSPCPSRITAVGSQRRSTSAFKRRACRAAKWRSLSCRHCGPPPSSSACSPLSAITLSALGRPYNSENGRDDAFLPGGERFWRRHVRLEDRREGVTIGNAVKAQCTDRHVQIGRVDVAAKRAGLFSTLDDAPNRVDRGYVELGNVRRLRNVFAGMQVLVHDEPHECRILLVPVEREGDELLQRPLGRQMIDVEIALDVADTAVSLFEHGDVEAFLAAEVVIDHPLAGARAGGDLVDARATQPLGGELLGRDSDDVSARLLGVVDPHRPRLRSGFRVRADRRADLLHRRNSTWPRLRCSAFRGGTPFPTRGLDQYSGSSLSLSDALSNRAHRLARGARRLHLRAAAARDHTPVRGCRICCRTPSTRNACHAAAIAADRNRALQRRAGRKNRRPAQHAIRLRDRRKRQAAANRDRVRAESGGALQKAPGDGSVPVRAQQLPRERRTRFCRRRRRDHDGDGG